MFIHLPLIHFAPPPRLLIDFKNSKLLTYFCFLLCIYCFSDLIGLLYVTWLSLLYKFIRFFTYFARNVRPYYPYWQYTDLFIFRFVNCTLTALPNTYDVTNTTAEKAVFKLIIIVVSIYTTADCSTVTSFCWNFINLYTNTNSHWRDKYFKSLIQFLQAIHLMLELNTVPWSTYISEIVSLPSLQFYVQYYNCNWPPK